MIDREIKFKLAKLAMTTGMSIETAKKYYEWITEEPEHEVFGNPTKWDDTPIEELSHETRIGGAVIKRCKDNGIHTVGDLIRCGAHKFGTFNLIGNGTVMKIGFALENHFGISDWYKT